MIWIPLFIHHIFNSHIYAGGLGYHANEYLINLIGSIGTTLLLIISFLIFITLRFNINPEKIKNLINKLKPDKQVITKENKELKKEKKVKEENNHNNRKIIIRKKTLLGIGQVEIQ